MRERSLKLKIPNRIRIILASLLAGALAAFSLSCFSTPVYNAYAQFEILPRKGGGEMQWASTVSDLTSDLLVIADGIESKYQAGKGEDEPNSVRPVKIEADKFPTPHPTLIFIITHSDPSVAEAAASRIQSELPKAVAYAPESEQGTTSGIELRSASESESYVTQVAPLAEKNILAGALVGLVIGMIIAPRAEGKKRDH